MEFSRQEYWSREPFLSPGNLPDPGIKVRSPDYRCILYCLSHQGSPDNEVSHWPLQLTSQERSRSCFLQPVNVSPFMASGTLLMWLSSGFWVGRFFLDYPNGSSVNIRVLFRRKKEGSNQNLKKRCDDRNRGRERQGHEQSNETASGRWKVHRFRPRAFGKNAALPTDFRTSDTENYKIKCVVLNLWMMIC